MIRQISFATKAAVSLGLTLNLLPVSLLLPQTLGLTTINKTEAITNSNQLAQYRPPRGMGSPGQTASGGTRDLRCPQDKEIAGPYLTALMPNDNSNDNPALMVDSNPKFFIYLPKTAAKKAEFVLKDESRKDVYRKSFSLSGEAGIIEVQLPPNTSLQIGKKYNWYFTMFCNPQDRGQSVFINAWSQKTELDSALAAKIQQAAPEKCANLYAQNGIWHEAVAILAEERRKKPNDPALADEWKKLLESAGVQKIGDVPFTLTQ